MRIQTRPERLVKLLFWGGLLYSCSAVAQSKSGVTLYGFLTSAYGYHQQTSKITSNNPEFNNYRIKKSEMGASDGMKLGPRWGIRGREDLGNGNSAIFTLESGFNLNNGESVMGALFARQAFVGLQSDDWGSLTLGRQYNAGADLVAPLSTIGATLSSHSFRYAFGSSVWDRYNNMIKYTSPSWGAAKWVFGVYHEREDTKTIDDSSYSERSVSRGISTGVSFSDGPFKVAGSFDISRQKGNISGSPHGYNAPIPGTYTSPEKNMTRKGWNVGMTYDFDIAKLHLLYGGQADGTFFDAGFLSYMPIPTEIDRRYRRSHGKGLRHYSWEAGVTVPVNSGMFKVIYMGCQWQFKIDPFWG